MSQNLSGWQPTVLAPEEDDLLPLHGPHCPPQQQRPGRGLANVYWATAGYQTSRYKQRSQDSVEQLSFPKERPANANKGFI